MPDNDIPWHPNRTSFNPLPSVAVDSHFPSGNLAECTVLSLSPITLGVAGNADISNDPTAKMRCTSPLPKSIKFVVLSANHLRRMGNRKVWVTCRRQGNQWKSLPVGDLEWGQGNAVPSVSFTFKPDLFQSKQIASLRQGQSGFQSKIRQSKPKAKSAANNYPQYNTIRQTRDTIGSSLIAQQTITTYYIATYLPYPTQYFQSFLHTLTLTPSAYFHSQTITYSTANRPIHLLTITSAMNVDTLKQQIPFVGDGLFPYPSERCAKIKNRRIPVIIITGRVHPSQTSASYFVEELIKLLLSDQYALLRELFLFQIIPLLNPDGVDNGNFRFDEQMRNLNRFYGHSSVQQTPSIFASENLILHHLPNLFMYLDVHSHHSPMGSFIYGNYTSYLDHMVENRHFCRLMESNMKNGGFQKKECDFSKKNMVAQERGDQYSKMCSGRVFVGKRQKQEEKQIFHAYTLQVASYPTQSQERLSFSGLPRKKTQQQIQSSVTQPYCRELSHSFLSSVLDILDLNPKSHLSQAVMLSFRKHALKQSFNQASTRFLLNRRDLLAQRNSSNETSKDNGNENLFTNQQIAMKMYIQRWWNHEQVLDFLIKIDPGQILREKWNRFIKKIKEVTGIPIFLQSQQKEKLEEKRKKESATVHSKSVVRNQVKPRQPIQSQVIFVCRTGNQKFGETVLRKKTIQYNPSINVRYTSLQRQEQIHLRTPRSTNQLKLTMRDNKKNKEASQDKKLKPLNGKIKKIKDRIHTQLANPQNLDQEMFIFRNKSKQSDIKLPSGKVLQIIPHPPAMFPEDYLLKISADPQSILCKINPSRQEFKHKLQIFKPQIKNDEAILPIIKRREKHQKKYQERKQEHSSKTDNHTLHSEKMLAVRHLQIEKRKFPTSGKHYC